MEVGFLEHEVEAMAKEKKINMVRGRNILPYLFRILIGVYYQFKAKLAKGLNLLRRRELETTETEERAIAKAASSGGRSI